LSKTHLKQQSIHLVTLSLLLLQNLWNGKNKDAKSNSNYVELDLETGGTYYAKFAR